MKTLTVLASILVRMRRSGITPVVVFDGRPPAAKAAVIEQRRAVRETAHKEMAEIKADLSANDMELTVTAKADRMRRLADLQRKAPTVTNGEKDDVKHFLYACGVMFVTANGEADDVLAAMVRRGEITAIVSTDMDMLARGVPMLVVPETPDASVLVEYSLAAVLRGLGVTYDQFVIACTLMGSDYTKHTMYPTAAISAAMAWDGDDDEIAEGVRLLCGEGAVWEEMLGEKQRDRLMTGMPPREPEALIEMGLSHSWPRDWVATLLE